MADETYPNFVTARPAATEVQDGDQLLLVRSGITYSLTPDLLPGRLLARAQTSANLDYTNGSDTIVNFATVQKGAGAITTGASWQYEVQADGWIDVRMVEAFVQPLATAYAADAYIEFDLYVNGGFVGTLAYYESGGTAGADQWIPLLGSKAIDVVAGDTVHVQFFNDSGATRRIAAGAAIEIYRV